MKQTQLTEVTQPRLEVLDTTLRDGCRDEKVKLETAEKLEVAQKLADLGVDYLEGGLPYASDRDQEFFRLAKDLRWGRTQLVAFGLVRHKEARAEEDYSLLALLAADTPVVSLVGKASSAQVKDVLGVSLEDNLKMIKESIRFLKRENRKVFFDVEHCFDGYRLDEAYTLRVLQVARDAGADRLVLCDTNGGSLPDHVGAVVAAVRCHLGPDTHLGIHCHNDGGLAVANTLAAVANGASHVQGTVNGFGERCGNADLVVVLPNLGLKLGYEVLLPGSLAKLTELSRFVYDKVNMNYSDNQPFVGNEAFAHTGGIDYAAMRKEPAYYEHIRPEAVGNRRRVLISDLSGRAGLIEKLDAFGLKYGSEDLVRILDAVSRLESRGWQFSAADATLHLLALKVLGRYRPWFETQHYSVLVRGNSANLDGEVAEASVKLKVGGRLQHTVSEGSGPVNALDRALRAALLPCYPELLGMKLKDYSVRVIHNTGTDDDMVRVKPVGDPLGLSDSTGSAVRVTVQSQDSEGNVWSTVAVSRDIMAASWAALVDAFEYKRILDARHVWGEGSQMPLTESVPPSV
jgi:2-isopropylmalate synthase